jgi:hypothetical protein
MTVRAFYNKVLLKLAIPHLSVNIKLIIRLSAARQEDKLQRVFYSAGIKFTSSAGTEVLAGRSV